MTLKRFRTVWTLEVLFVDVLHVILESLVAEKFFFTNCTLHPAVSMHNQVFL